MIHHRSQALGWFCLLVGPFLSPVSTSAAAVPEEAVTYYQDIVPIFRQECFACHNEDDPQGDLDLTRYTTMMAGGSSGIVIDPGNLKNSRLYASITHTIEPAMPPESPPIAKASIERIRQWIEGGAIEGRMPREVALVKENQEQWIPKEFEPGTGPMPPRLSRQNRLHTKRNPTSRSIAVSPTAPLLAVPGNRQIWLYRSDTLEPLGRFAFREGEITVLAFSRDGTMLLAAGGEAGRNGKVVLWRVLTAERVLELGEELDTVLAADISSDNRRIALGGVAGKVKLYDIPSKKLVSKIDAHTDWITAIAFSPDGVLLASADDVGGLQIHEGWSGKPYLTLRGTGASVTDLAWRADSNILASGGADRIVRLWEVEKGKQVKAFEPSTAEMTSVSAVPDDRWLVSGRDGNTRLLLSDGVLIRSFGPLADLVTASRFCPLTGRVIVSGYEGEVVVFDGASGMQVGELQNNPLPLAQSLQQIERKAEKALSSLVMSNTRYKSAKKLAAQAGAEVSKMQLRLKMAQEARKEMDQKLRTARREARQHAVHLAEVETDILKRSKAIREAGPDRKDPAEKILSALRQERSAAIVAKKLVRNRINVLGGELERTAAPIEREQIMCMIVRSEYADAQRAEAAAKRRLMASIKGRNQLISEAAGLIEDASFASTIDVLMQRQSLLEKRFMDQATVRDGEKAEGPDAASDATEKSVPEALEQLRSQIREIRKR